MVILITTTKCFNDYFRIASKKSDSPVRLPENLDDTIAYNNKLTYLGLTVRAQHML